MDGESNERESLISRIEQLEQERDNLRNDIEQLCLQQAGPSYLAVATRMHFQSSIRTAGLEQEIDTLKRKLAICTRDNHNLQEELTEIYSIKSQLADLHNGEVSKNLEVEKQLKFLQGCVASAFAERDKSLMEAEKAKEHEEAFSQKLVDLQNRIKELKTECSEVAQLNTALQIEVAELKEQNETLEKVINKMYEIRQSDGGSTEQRDWRAKCNCLLDDPSEMWSFSDYHEVSSSRYGVLMEKELEMLKGIVDNLQIKLRVGLAIEDYLRNRNCQLEEQQNRSNDLICNSLSSFRNFHAQFRCEVANFLEEERNQLGYMMRTLQEKIVDSRMDGHKFDFQQSRGKTDEVECRDVHISSDVDPCTVAEQYILDSSASVMDGGKGDASDALGQALQEKVAALLLLSQQEERHLLEREVHAALQKKVDELQRNLLQVMNEKVKGLMELAHLQQEHQLLKESIGEVVKLRNSSANNGDRSIAAREKLRSLLNRTYLRRWVGQLAPGDAISDAESYVTSRRQNYSVDIASLKIENATLQESITSMEHLTSSVRRLRLLLLKAKEAVMSSTRASIVKALDNIIVEAKLVKIALGTSLPVSWSAETDLGSQGGNPDDSSDHLEDSVIQKADTISAAGFEMVELLILAAELLREQNSQ